MSKTPTTCKYCGEYPLYWHIDRKWRYLVSKLDPRYGDTLAGSRHYCKEYTR